MLILGVLSIVLIAVTDMDAQRRRTRDRDSARERERDRREAQEELSKVFHSIHMGNISFFNGSFSLSAKYSGGYKPHERIGVGLSGKFFFDILNRVGGDDLNLFSYGTGAFVRAKITEDIYLQAEYDVTSYDNITFRDIYTYPLVGGGYQQGNGPWKFGANALFLIKSEIRDLEAVNNRFVEWWITFDYNF